MRPVSRTYEVFGFESTHAALDAEALFDDMGIESVTIPAPAALSSRCGIALRLPPEQADRAASYLANSGIRIASRLLINDL